MPSQIEGDRLKAVSRYCILDSSPEETFDRIAALLARMLDVPHACVSIVDRDRVWFKTAHGLDMEQVARQPGFCHTVVETGELLHYEDATSDDRARFNDLSKGDGGIRFYVGAPLRTRDGFRIGTLCAFASVQRGLTDTERQCVTDLTDLVMHEIEARRTRNQLERTEAVLQHSQRLESVGMIASGVAHDFNNLLGGIIGNIGLLKMETIGTDRAREMLEEIEVVAQRAAALSGQVLAYAGREDGPADTALNLNDILHDIKFMIDSVVHGCTTVSLELDPRLPAVCGNSISLGQVAINLITNASDSYGGAPGSVRVKTTSHSDGIVRLSVSDDGTGMDEATRSRVLEAFFTTKVGGRGLGMAVVGRIVQQMGGTIEVDSQQGVGTTVRIDLPCSAESSSARDQGSDEAGPWRAEGTVLVVDDESIILNVVSRSLALAGLDVLTANCGETALRVFDEKREQIIAAVIDLSMPGMDGAEVSRAMQAIAPGLPVILISGHSAEDVAARVDVGELRGFLKKPFSQSQLINAVRDAITV